jgi:hypothetical protein
MKKDQNSVSFTLRKPQEDRRDYEQLIKIYDFLKGNGELTFDPPFIASPPSGERDHAQRALYLMAAGLEALEAKYPKRKGATATPPSESRSGGSQTEEAMF